MKVGALAALRCAADARLHAAAFYVGVSAGAFVTAGLANGITPREMVAAFIENEGGTATRCHPVFMPLRCAVRLARGEPARRGDGGIVGQCKSLRPSRTVRAAAPAAIPTGLFDNRPSRRAMRELLSKPGHSNDFRELPARLFLIATDLDSGRTVEFGAKAWTTCRFRRRCRRARRCPACTRR